MTPSGKTHSPARLLAVRRLSDSVFLQVYGQAHIARGAKPGQFVQMQTSAGLDPFFRRPMSIFAAEPKQGTFSVVFAVVGKGTRRLALAKVGDELAVIGPLGNTFTLPRRCSHAILVAGGVGLPPLDFWARHLLRTGGKKAKPEVTLLLGARSDWERIKVPAARGIRRLWSTDDGSFGFRGTVVDLLKKLHTEERWPVEETAVYGCGPTPMLRALQEWVLAQGYRGQLSLEGLMPCGFGVCSGCVVSGRPEREGYERFVRVCYDGPVFEAGEVSL